MADNTPQEFEPATLSDTIRLLATGLGNRAGDMLGVPGDIEKMLGVGTRWGTRVYPGSDEIRPQIQNWMAPYLPADSGWRPLAEWARPDSNPSPPAQTMQAPQQMPGDQGYAQLMAAAPPEQAGFWDRLIASGWARPGEK